MTITKTIKLSGETREVARLMVSPIPQEIVQELEVSKETYLLACRAARQWDYIRSPYAGLARRLARRIKHALEAQC